MLKVSMLQSDLYSEYFIHVVSLLCKITEHCHCVVVFFFFVCLFVFCTFQSRHVSKCSSVAKHSVLTKKHKARISKQINLIFSFLTLPLSTQHSGQVSCFERKAFIPSVLHVTHRTQYCTSFGIISH